RMFFGGLRQSVDLEAPPAAFAEAARGLGCAGFFADRPSAIGEALDAAFATGGPAAGEGRVDPAAAPAPHSPPPPAPGRPRTRPGAPSPSPRCGAAARRALTRRKDLHTVPPECGRRFPAGRRLPRYAPGEADDGGCARARGGVDPRRRGGPYRGPGYAADPGPPGTDGAEHRAPAVLE